MSTFSSLLFHSLTADGSHRAEPILWATLLDGIRRNMLPENRTTLRSCSVFRLGPFYSLALYDTPAGDLLEDSCLRGAKGADLCFQSDWIALAKDVQGPG